MAGFSNPIPRATQPRFAEGTSLASNRDDRNNSKLWKKNRTSVGQLKTDGNALALLQRQVASMRRVKSGGFLPTPATENFFPFKIYNIENATDSTLSSRTFQIRGGLIGYRPQYATSNLTVSQIADLMQGNYELSLIGTGTDPVLGAYAPYEVNAAIYASADWYAQPEVNTGGSVEISLDGTATLICSNQVSSPNPTNVQIVIPQSSGTIWASFWIVIKDDAVNGAYTELWGKIGSPLYNDLTNVTVGLGSIILSPSSYSITQIQDGHLTNRYLEKSPQPANQAGAKYWQFGNVYRGWWIRDALVNKVFYPGDIVVDDTINVVVASTNCYKSYVISNNGGLLVDRLIVLTQHSDLIGYSRPWGFEIR